MWIQNDLKWDKNISEISIKTNRRLYMLRMLTKFGFNTQELVAVYKGYIRPLLEYADSVWHSSLSVKQSKTLEQFQRRACRIILGWNFSSYSEALKTCELETLSDRRENHCLRFAEGLSNISRTSDLLLPVRGVAHARNLRSANKLSTFFTRTSRFQNSPIPFFTSLLNGK